MISYGNFHLNENCNRYPNEIAYRQAGGWTFKAITLYILFLFLNQTLEKHHSISRANNPEISLSDAAKFATQISIS